MLRSRVLAAAVIALGTISFSYSPTVRSQTVAPLEQQRADAALAVFNTLVPSYTAGTATLDDIGAWGARWYQARRDAGVTGAALVTAAQEWATKMRATEALAGQRFHAGVATRLRSTKRSTTDWMRSSPCRELTNHADQDVTGQAVTVKRVWISSSFNLSEELKVAYAERLLLLPLAS